MTDLKDLIKEVLEKGYLMSLGTVDEGGVWVADVIYVHDDSLNIYWFSDPDCRHSQALLNHKAVAATVTVSNAAGEDDLGLQIAGVAEKLEGGRLPLEIAHARKRGKPVPTNEGEILDGDSWYVLKPTKIQIINKKLFGWDKQTLDL